MTYLTRQFLKGLCQRRCFSTTKVRFIDPKSVEEVKIPVPWGQIAGKWWGDKSQQPIIALHGYVDNANSFDKLMPLLEAPSILCIDLPGHGYSDHLPRGMCLELTQYIVILRYLFKHCLKLNGISFIGQSFGSSLSFTYAGAYPDDVHSMVNIDCGRIVGGTIPGQTVREIRDCIEVAFYNEFDHDTRGYTWEESLKHTYKNRKKAYFPLNLESCEIILKRGTKSVGNDLFRFSFDNRLRVYSAGRFPSSFNVALAKRIKCNVLNIIPKSGIASIKMLSPLHKEYDKTIKEMEISCKNFISIKVEGCHQVHLEAPQNISSIINDFLKTTAVSS